MLQTFIEKFKIPDVAVKFIDIMFTENDKIIGTKIEKEIFTKNDVADLISMDAQAYLDDAYQRGIVCIVNRERGTYKLNYFYGFLDVFCVTSKEKYHAEVSREDRGKIDDWYFKAYCDNLDQDYSKPPTQDRILTLEEALEYVDRDERQLYWTHCDCKCLLGDCGLPTKVCLSYYQGDNSYSDRKVSEPVSKEKAKQIIVDADKAGLIHTWNPNGFCNCCGDCCYLFRAQEVRDSKRIWPIQEYVISFIEENCIGCGLCIKRCHFKVFTKKQNRKISLDTSKCMGCGLCANTCQRNALKLERLCSQSA